MTRKYCIVLIISLMIIATVAPNVMGAEEDLKFGVVSFMLHPYSGPTEVAVEDFEEETGIETEFNAPERAEQELQNRIIEGMIARGFNGLAIFPSDSVAGNQTITEVSERGIPVVAWGGPPQTPTDAKLCIATDVKAAAEKSARLVIEEMGEEGNLVQLLGELSDPNTILRRDGVREVVEEYEDVELVQEVADIDTFEAASEQIDNLMAARGGEIDGIVATAYVPTVVTAETLEAMDRKDIVFIGMDDDESVLNAIEKGYVTGTMVQAPYTQGYLALTALNLLHEGYTVKDDVWFVDSGVIYVTEGNLDTFEEKVQEETFDMLETFEENYFISP